ncbi:MAG: glycoside hydrolase family 20 zincin-like fold domain-containing protein, partial [bacterium]
MKNWILLPKPCLMKAGEGVLNLASITRISLPASSVETMRAAEAIRSAGSELAGVIWPIRKGAGRGSAKGAILLKLDAKAAPAQGYRLVVGRANITLTAADAAGLFHGAMTLKQLLRQASGRIPAMAIEDYPD